MNIKDRVNRHNVIRLLTTIESHFDEIYKKNVKGLFIFCGIDETKKEIFILLEPMSINNMFFYNCGAKFVTDIFLKYYDKYDGTILFVNGEHALIYKYNTEIGKFELNKTIISAIPSKHNKGGQSAVRFGRIADNIREKYILNIIEYLLLINDNNLWLFGSKDITDDIKYHNPKKNINYGGYIEFDKTTINDTSKWLKYVKENTNNDKILKDIVYTIDTNSELLDFGENIFNNTTLFEVIVVNPYHKNYNKQYEKQKKVIKITKSSETYERLKNFIYIGKMYFVQNNDILTES